MANIIRIRDLTQETALDDNILFPIDKSSYSVNAKHVTMSDLAAYIAGDTSSYYVNDQAVPDTIGGISAGTTFPSPGYSMKEMWDMLLYPYQAPSFTSFSLNRSTPKEIGDGFNDGVFSWSTSNSSNVANNSINISGYNMTTLSNLNNDGTEGVTFTSLVTRDSSDSIGSRIWNIQGTNTNSGTFSRSYSIRWDWRWYWGTSSNTSLTSSQIVALSSNNLYSSFSRTYSFGGGGYKYLCFANVYGGPSNFVDSDTGFGVAMYGGYSNSENGISYDIVSITNTYGETTNYRVYRTQNIITDAIDIIVS